MFSYCIILLYTVGYFRMEFLDMPSNSLHSFCSHSTALLPNLIQKTHKMLTNSTLELFEHFGTLLSEIEKHTYSSKELWRLHAAYALVILSRTSCIVLIHLHSYRYRLIFSWECCIKSSIHFRKLEELQTDVSCPKPIPVL